MPASLFEDHKLLYSFIMTVALETHANNVDPVVWRFVIMGTSLNPIEGIDNPAPEWITSQMWSEVCALSGVEHVWGGFCGGLLQES